MAHSYEDRILRVLEHIYDNPAGDLSLDALADVAAMSRFHWHRVFRALTGETCAQMVRRIRLHLAAMALVQGDETIDRVAYQVGYPNSRSFARVFAEAYGMTPAAFRKAGRLLPFDQTLLQKGPSMYPVDIRNEPARTLTAVAHKGAYGEIGRSFESFAAICSSRGLWPRMREMIGVYLDAPDTVAESDLRSYAGASSDLDDAPDGMEQLTLRGGRTAVMTYKGPYSGIHGAYGDLFGAWLPKSGEEPADLPCYEIYLNDPQTVAPEDLLTEICLPLK
ncbi:Methylphosphotriester-DNA--protein-cysteine S-methyltransferase [Phaeobacter italicus]|jgi:AraC family transcriptional regulator|uniref:Methylphosphotriester-DNA--protein-cysteine S-methyltransferase n=1 Tax=Phaeobacter italicus TaxID=481446 RepID=A0A0H5DJD2_9RHOB|nr:AraC family transcriptional regulator [Phaeobacter italicus]CRL12865.1 Methylphosphotriester-DNA--protein-cysteine S-methyltransferase [Phaeobacter italicus]